MLSGREDGAGALRHLLVSPTTGCRSPKPRSRHGAASCAHGRRHRCPLASLSRFPLQWTRLLPRPHVAVSVTPGKARMLAHQAEWSLLSGRDGILDRSRNGQVRRSSREARRQRDGGHEQQESTPQRRCSARGLHGWPARWSLVHLTASGDGSRQQPQRRASGERRRQRRCAAVVCAGALDTRCPSPRPYHSPVLCAAAVGAVPGAALDGAVQRRHGGRRRAPGPQSGRNRLGRPSNRINSNNNHPHQNNKVKRKNVIKINMVGGVLSPQGGREASFLTAARSAKKISRCKNSTAVDNYPRAIRRALSKTKIKIGKTAISRRSFFHFWRPSSGPLPNRTAAPAPAHQEACESEEFAFGLWWPLRGGVRVFWLQWPPEGSPAWLPAMPVYAQR